MANFEREDGMTRDDLVQRVALMEAMIAEGRQCTARFGWCFVLWGVIDICAMGWQYLQPTSYWAWPVSIAIGVILQFTGIAVLRRKSGIACGKNARGRSIQAVWGMMGVTATLYFAAAMAQDKTWQISFFAAMMMFVGMAHGTSALILRWRAQGLVAGCWWVGGIAMFFVPWPYPMGIFVVEMFFGMILFGLYAMWLERRRAAALELHHA
jgi:hypothetical protein